MWFIPANSTLTDKSRSFMGTCINYFITPNGFTVKHFDA